MINKMDTTGAVDPILGRFRQALRELYGPALDRVVLFGSRARGESTPDSDYDVAVFLKGVDDLMPEFNRLADLRVEFLDRDGAFFEAIPFRASAYGERTPIMHEIRSYGLTL
jgi:predicted nucleotidyltransferase